MLNPSEKFRLSIYPNYPEAIEFYGLVEPRMGYQQEARRLLEIALSRTRKDNINYDFMAVNLAALLIQLGEYDGALKLLNQEIADSPGYACAWSNRAVLHYKLGDLAAARADAQAALRLDPTNAQAQNLLNLLSAPTASPGSSAFPGFPVTPANPPRRTTP